MYRRKYPKIVIDGEIGAITEDGFIVDKLIIHQEIKGSQLSKSETSGLQEAIDIASQSPNLCKTVFPPANNNNTMRIC